MLYNLPRIHCCSVCDSAILWYTEVSGHIITNRHPDIAFDYNFNVSSENPRIQAVVFFFFLNKKCGIHKGRGLYHSIGGKGFGWRKAPEAAGKERQIAGVWEREPPQTWLNDHATWANTASILFPYL